MAGGEVLIRIKAIDNASATLKQVQGALAGIRGVSATKSGGGFFGDLFKTIGEAWKSPVAGMAKGIGNVLKGAFDVVVSVAKASWNVIQLAFGTVVGGMIELVTRGFEAAFSWIGMGFKAVFGGVVGIVSSAMNGIGSIIKGVAGIVTGVLSAAFKTVTGVIGGIFNALTSVKGLIVAIAGGAALRKLIEGFAQAGSELELTIIRLQGLLGSRQAGMSMISELRAFSAKNAIFEVRELQRAFVQFKAAGIDPLNGSLQSVADAVAAFGGSTFDFQKAILAITQMAGKGVISSEELRQQLGERIPRAVHILARELGLTLPQMYKKLETGSISAKEGLDALFRGFSKDYSGSVDRVANTFTGVFAKLRNEFRMIQEDTVAVDSPNGIWAQLKNAIESFYQSVKTNHDRIVKLFQSMFLAVKATVNAMDRAIRQVLGKSTFEGFLDGAKEMFISIAAGADTAGFAIRRFAGDFVSVFNKMFEFAAGKVSGLIDALFPKQAQISEFVSEVSHNLSRAIEANKSLNANRMIIGGRRSGQQFTRDDVQDIIEQPFRNLNATVELLAAMDKNLASILGREEMFGKVDFSATLFRPKDVMLALYKEIANVRTNVSASSDLLKQANSMKAVLDSMREAWNMRKETSTLFDHLGIGADDAYNALKRMRDGLVSVYDAAGPIADAVAAPFAESADLVAERWTKSRAAISAAFADMTTDIKIAAEKSGEAFDNGFAVTGWRATFNQLGDGFRKGVTEKVDDFTGKFKTAMDYAAEVGRITFDNMVGMFDDIFLQGIEGKLNSFRDVFNSFLKGIAQDISKILSNQLTSGIMGQLKALFPSFNSPGGVGKDSSPLPGFGSGNGLGGGSSGLSPGTLNMAGPVDMTRLKSGGGSPVNVQLINNSGTPMQAQASFSVDQFGQQVVSIVLDAINRNRSGMRTAIASV